MKKMSDTALRRLFVSRCSACGAAFAAVRAENTCPYCGGAMREDRPAGEQVADCILPFRLTKQQAVENLTAYYKGRVLLPKAFRVNIRQLRAVYVPCRIYDAKAEAVGEYAAQVVSTHREADCTVTQTDHYNAHRAGEAIFSEMTMGAARKLPQGLLDAIEPFDEDGWEAFVPEKLGDCLVDLCPEEREDCARRAVSRMETTVRKALQETLSSYTSANPLEENISVQLTGERLALVPVWVLHSSWRGRHWVWAVNGRTGAMAGDLPIDKKRVAACFFAIAVPLAIAAASLLR